MMVSVYNRGIRNRVIGNIVGGKEECWMLDRDRCRGRLEEEIG